MVSRRISGPVPSITYLKYSIYSLLVSHPLLIDPPIYDSVTGEQLRIEKWSMIPGRDYSGKRTLSIYPFSSLSEASTNTPPAPQSAISTTVKYNQTSVGSDGTDEGVYLLVVKLQMMSVVNLAEIAPYKVTVPKESVLHPDDWLHTSPSQREVDLYIDPAGDAIGDYLELIRLALLDRTHIQHLGMNFLKPDVLYSNCWSMPWDKEDAAIYKEGEMLIRLTVPIAKGWRDKFVCPVREIQLRTDPN